MTQLLIEQGHLRSSSSKQEMDVPCISPKLPFSTLQKLALTLCPELAGERQEIDLGGQRSQYQ